MQAVIMAAGRGSRLGEISKNTPKALVKICGKSIIDYTFSSLPPEIDRAILVVGHLGHIIRDYLKNKFQGIEISYVEQKDIPGTAGALWQAAPFLKDEKFLVINGDDLYMKDEIAGCLKYDISFGLTKRYPLVPLTISIDVDSSSMLNGWHRPSEEEMKKGVNIANGVYVLDKRIFDYQPVKISNGEFGLPHTILDMAKDHKVRGEFMDYWFQINRPEDIANAELSLAVKQQ